MKKLFLLLLFPALTFGTQWVWDGGHATVGKWSEATNWTADASYPQSATDTVSLNNTSVDPCTLDVSPSIAQITIASNYTGFFVMTGQTMTCAYGFSDDGITNAHNYGNGITWSTTFHIGSGISSNVATSCVLTPTGANSIIDDDKGLTLKQCVVPISAGVTNSGTGFSTYSNAGPVLVLGNNSRFTNNKYLKLTTTTNGDLWIIGTAVTFNGNATFDLNVQSGIAMTIPATTYTGATEDWYIHTWTPYTNGGSISLTGNFNIGSIVLYLYSNIGTTFTFNTNNYAFTCGILGAGSNLVTAQCTFNWGSSIVTVASLLGTLNAAYTTGYSQMNFQTSQWPCSGNWTFGANWTIAHTSDIVTLTGTGAQLVTLNGKQGYDWTVANTGTATVKFLDSLSLLGDLILSDGRDSIGRVDCIDYTNTTNDSVFHTDTTIIRGSYYRNNAKVSRAAGGGKLSFRGAADGTINLLDAGTMGPISIRKTGGKKVTALSAIRAGRVLDSTGVLKMGVYAMACTTLTVSDTGLQCAAVTLDTLNSNKGGTLGGGTIARWNWLVNGLRHLLTAGTTLAANSVNGLGGTITAPDSLIGSGGTATLNLGGATITAPYFYAKDLAVINGTIIATTGGVNGGNTSGITWPAATSGRRRGGGWLGLGLWLGL